MRILASADIHGVLRVYQWLVEQRIGGFGLILAGDLFDADFEDQQRQQAQFIERILTNNAAFDGWPAWSPDGKHIAFASNRLGPANQGKIFVMSPDGSAMRQISVSPGSYVQPFWSADGRNIYAYNAIEVGDDEWGDVVVFAFDSR
jgi:Tol biopolymer transport system component